MRKFPQVSGSDVVRALLKLGFTIRRQHCSHIIIMLRDDPFAQPVVPDHRQLDRGTLRAIFSMPCLVTRLLVLERPLMQNSAKCTGRLFHALSCWRASNHSMASFTYSTNCKPP